MVVQCVAKASHTSSGGGENITANMYLLGDLIFLSTIWAGLRRDEHILTERRGGVGTGRQALT